MAIDSAQIYIRSGLIRLLRGCIKPVYIFDWVGTIGLDAVPGISVGLETQVRLIADFYFIDCNIVNYRLWQIDL